MLFNNIKLDSFETIADEYDSYEIIEDNELNKTNEIYDKKEYIDKYLISIEDAVCEALEYIQNITGIDSIEECKDILTKVYESLRDK